jgi:hypothetical protein
MEALAGGSIGEIVAGGGAVVLSIIALAGMLPAALTAVATIAVGSALFFEGAAVATSYRELLHRVAGGTTEALEFGGGMTAESLGGLAGVALGILALVGVAPTVLLSVAAIVLGAAILLGAGVTGRLNDLQVAQSADETRRLVAREAVAAATGTQVLVGAGALVLGIIAVQGIAAPVLVATAMLSLGASVLFAGSALGGKVIAIRRG